MCRLRTACVAVALLCGICVAAYAAEGPAAAVADPFGAQPEQPVAAEQRAALEALNAITHRYELNSAGWVAKLDFAPGWQGNVNRAVTDADLKLLRNFPQLERLVLSGAPIADRGAAQLAELTGLKELDLSHTLITNRALEHLSALRELKSLFLGGTRITEHGMPHVAKLKQLRVLNLQCAIAPSGLERLTELPELRELSLGPKSNRVILDDRALDTLKKFHRLEVLNLELTDVTSNRCEELQLHLECRIVPALHSRGERFSTDPATPGGGFF